jgi:hypothetical protein
MSHERIKFPTVMRWRSVFASLRVRSTCSDPSRESSRQQLFQIIDCDVLEHELCNLACFYER